MCGSNQSEKKTKEGEICPESLKITKQIRKVVLLPFADDVWRPKS